MKAQGIFVLLVSVGVGISAFSCSSNDTATTGAGGSSAGGGGPVTQATTKAASTTAAVVGTGSGGGSGSNLGVSCTTNSDCGAGSGLQCSTSTMNDPVFGGGPAAGYCTKACTSTADCPMDGECVGAAGMMECLLTCTPGPALTYINDSLDPTKCQGRSDLKCVTLTDNSNACLPSCGEDSQCDGGRFCDPQLSVCVTTPHMGDKLGAVCTPPADGGTDSCAGACGQFNFGAPGMVTFCSEPCTLGGPCNDGGTMGCSDIADSTNCGGLQGGLCIFSQAMNGAGDQGFCDPACTTQDDCIAPVTWCVTVNFQQGNGYCLTTTECKVDTDCVDAMTMMSTGTCTLTKSGKSYCLDPKWPLGKQAPTDGGGAGGSGGKGAGGGDAGKGGSGGKGGAGGG